MLGREALKHWFEVLPVCVPLCVSVCAHVCTYALCVQLGPGHYGASCRDWGIADCDLGVLLTI